MSGTILKRASIYYQLFSRFPALFFELVENPPTTAAAYRFESVEVKDTAFRIDGVFLPPDDADPRVVFFIEVQFQKDEFLYYRFFTESFLYLNRHRGYYDDWCGVILFPSRRLEPGNPHLHRALLVSDQVQRIYLDELGDPLQQPIGIHLMQLTIASEEALIIQAKQLMARLPTEIPNPPVQHEIIDLISTIVVYKFAHLSREQVEAMLEIRLQETRVYQEAKEEGRQEGRQEGQLEGERSLMIRLLSHRFGVLNPVAVAQIQQLCAPQLDALGSALLDFSTSAELLTWLESQGEEKLDI